MTDDDTEAVDKAEPVESVESRRRVNALLEALLEDEPLSDEARSVLRHLQETPEELVEMDSDELANLLLEGLS